MERVSIEDRIIYVTFNGPVGQKRVLGYPYLWIKAVTGFCRTEHCARCLKGPFLKPTNDWAPPPNVRTAYALPRNAVALYICGVSRRGYQFNLHAPVALADDDAPRIEMPMIDDQSLLVEHAKLLDIPPLKERWKGLDRTFTTCRNFQFGVAHFGYPRSKPVKQGSLL